MENTTCEKKNLGFWKMFGMFMLAWYWALCLHQSKKA